MKWRNLIWSVFIFFVRGCLKEKKKPSGYYFLTNIYDFQLYKKLYEKCVDVKARN